MFEDPTLVSYISIAFFSWIKHKTSQSKKSSTPTKPREPHSSIHSNYTLQDTVRLQTTARDCSPKDY